MADHEHRFIFLRQENQTTKQWDDRVLERLVCDVFFCENCLTYNRVPVRREVPDTRSFGWTEVPL